MSELNGTTGHGFAWETQGNPADLYAPFLFFELSSGVGEPGHPVNSSMSDTAIIALWDKITSSLRVRPAKAAKAAPAAPVIPPLGTHASANTACPASGWWQCSDGDERIKVEHGDYQYFHEGERMPQASLLAPPTLWQRLTGERVRFNNRMETLWTLASYRKSPRPRVSAVPPLARNPSQSVDTESLLDKLGETNARTLQVPVGTLAATNNPCPASPETAAIDGARWFRQGDLMPIVSIELHRTW